MESESKMLSHHKVIILGSGPAGATAALYTARANLQPLVIAGNQRGGQLTTTTMVENFPGFPDGLDGTELVMRMEKQAINFKAQFISGAATKVDLKNRPFKIEVDQDCYTTDALIVATGAEARWLGIPGEDKYKGRGVSACATCDGFFFKGKEIAVVGGGDSALEEAIFLTNFASKVFLLHRRDELRASKIMQEKVFKNEKIKIVWNSIPLEVLGDPSGPMSSIKIQNTQNKEISELKVAGFFVAIGHSPNTELFKGILETDRQGYIQTKAHSTETNITGVFACGDVMDSRYRQAITAAGTGCMAAIDLEKHLA